MGQIAKKAVSGLVILFSLILAVFAFKEFPALVSKALTPPDEIIIDTLEAAGAYNRTALSFAQGGEELPPMLKSVVEKMKIIKPRYIRLDHIYDFYNVVKLENGNYLYDFQKLDETVDDILKMGALPFFSLSYFPRSFTLDNSLIGLPKDWALWQNLVQKTIERYSGRNNKNLNNIYYEVWNEPDLPQFGSWKLKGDKNYNHLYYYAAKGALETTGVNNYYLGGPSAGSYYPVWVNSFLKFVTENNLRLDFYSWHRYHTDPSKFAADAQNIRSLLANFSKFQDLPLVLSEWGINSENNEDNNQKSAQAHAVHTAVEIDDNIDLAFNFEVKDGPPPNGGKWGLIGHESSAVPLKEKPKYYAFKELNNLGREKFKVTYSGKFLKALASKNSPDNYSVLVANYDYKNSHLASFPLTFTGLKNGPYVLSLVDIQTSSSSDTEIIVSDGSLKYDMVLFPNDVVRINLQLKGTLADFIDGTSLSAGDKALVMQNGSSLKLPLALLSQAADFQIDFDLKPLWDGSGEKLNLLMADLGSDPNLPQYLMLEKITSKSIDFLQVKLVSGNTETIVALPINNWQEQSWHHLAVSLKGAELTLAVDGQSNAQKLAYPNGLPITEIEFMVNPYVLDNLVLSGGEKIILQRSFNGSVTN